MSNHLSNSIQFTIMKEQRIFTFEKLEPVSFMVFLNIYLKMRWDFPADMAVL